MADTTIEYDDFVDNLTEESSPAKSDMLPSKKVGVTAKKVQAQNLISGKSGVYQNAIINGDMKIVQDGTYFPAIAQGYFFDQWFYGDSSVAVNTITQDSDTPSSEEILASMKIDCTTADAVVDAGDIIYIAQMIEGFNFKPYWNKTFTLKFWVKATKTGIYCIAFQNQLMDRHYVAEYTVNSPNTWEEKVITVTHSDVGIWLAENNIGIRVFFTLMAGSNYTTSTLNSWQAGDKRASTNQVNACDNVANDFLITGVQLNLGASPLLYMPRQYKEELALCQRYFNKYIAFETVGTGNFYNVNLGRIGVHFPVEMRVNPTLLLSAVGAISIYNSNSHSTTWAIVINQSGKHSILLDCSASGTMGNGCSAHIRTTGEWIAFDARL